MIIYLHCDMNNYYASCEEVYDPSLKEIPFCVIGDPTNRSGIVLSRNALAKKLGIISGISSYEAKKLVSNIKFVVADYQKYHKFTKSSREIYYRYTNKVIPYGLDEAWLIIEKDSYKEAKEVADEIRKTIEDELNLTISVGISFNYIFSKLASDLHKPNKTTLLIDLEKDIWPLPAFMMLFVGPVIRKTLKKYDILTIEDLAKTDPLFMKQILGKKGMQLIEFAKGIDSSFDPSNNLENQTISNTITTKTDLVKLLDIKTLIYALAICLVKRLNNHHYATKCLSLKIKYYDFETVSKQVVMDVKTNLIDDIYLESITLLDKILFVGKPVRSIGITLSKLTDFDFLQQSLFTSLADYSDVKENLKKLQIEMEED